MGVSKVGLGGICLVEVCCFPKEVGLGGAEAEGVCSRLISLGCG